MMEPKQTSYNELLNTIGSTIETARQNAVKDVYHELVKANSENW